MKTCPNCGYEVLLDKPMCPNCGQPVVTNAAWPPAPTNAPVPSPRNMGKLITGKRWGDLWVGFLLSWLLLILVFFLESNSTSDGENIITCVSLLLAVFIYFGNWRVRPTFARGFGFGLLSIVVVSLGAFAICISLPF